MSHQPQRVPTVVIASVIILTVLVVSLAILPYLFSTISEVYQLPGAQKESEREQSEDAILEEEIQKATQFGRLVKTKPTIAQTLTPIRIAGQDFPFEAVFSYGAESFDFPKEKLNDDFLSRELSLTLPPSSKALVLVLELPILEMYKREGFPDAETLIALIKPESVLAIIEQEDSRLTFFVDRNEVVEELARLKEL